MSNTTNQILTLLKDDSFPSMVILDGEWGVGKTHYIKEELIPALKDDKGKKVIYFSLTGLSNIDDFRDKLISAVYLSENLDQNFIDKFKDSVFSILKHTGDNAGTVASILKGSTGIVKHAMLNRITDVTIILDDLERVSDKKLEKIIVGECLQLIDEKNLEFIFVMNGKKTEIDKAMIEKSFSDRVYFKRSSQEIINIAFQGYEYFNAHQKFIEQEINNLEFTNLRAMKRAAKRLDNIYKIVNNNTQIDINTSMLLIIKDVLRISYLHYCLEKSSEEIIKGLDYLLNSPSKANKTSNTKDEFEKYRTYNTPSEEMVEYCSGKIHIAPSIEQLGRLPSKSSPIDKFMFSRCYTLSPEEFDRLLIKFKTFIFTDVDVPISMWFEACDFYVYLLVQGFIEGNKEEFIKDVDALCSKKDFNTSDLNTRRHYLKITNSEILKTFNQQKETAKKETSQNTDTLRLERIKKSWTSVDDEIYKEFQTTNFITKYSEYEWLCAINNWKSRDIGEFSDFLFNRYNSSNICNFLAEEKITLVKLNDLLKAELDDCQPSQKKGTLKLLQNAITTGIDKL